MNTDAGRELAEAMAQVARALEAEDTAEKTLHKITEMAVASIEGCEHAGVSIVDGERITTDAATSDVPGVVDRIQYETGQGPCLDAIREHEIYLTGDLAAEDRWPEFATRATEETGVRSMLSFRLFLEQDTFGALNLYSRRPDAFTDTSTAVGKLFAAHAAIALSAAREQDRVDELADDLQDSRRRADEYRQQADVAAVLQRSMLTDLPDLAPLRVAARYVPATRAADVGGDWYDAFVLPGGAVVLAVGDIAGHDVHAATAMAQARSLLRGLAVDRDGPPGELLTRFDAVFRHLRVAPVATCLVARVEQSGDGWRAEFASAGHPPPLLLTPAGARYLELPEELLLGTDRRPQHTTCATALPPGATLLLYTDGLVERRDRSVDDGLTALRAAATEISTRCAGRPADLDALCDELLARLAPHPTDDVCLLALHIPAAPSRRNS